MKICCYTDLHWCKFSSVIRDVGSKYSVRLEHLLDSINWAEKLAEDNKCDLVVNLGDFFDSPIINDTEMAAFSEIKWSNIPHKMILGNHEIQNRDKEVSSAHIFKLLKFDLITEPKFETYDNIDLCYLPYTFEFDSLNNIFKDSTNKRIVFSHNDIEGIQLGGYTFDKGFSLKDISKNCELFLNGHIHAKGEYGNMINLGNLCGQNFGENFVPHNAYILDTDTMELQAFENPYSFNFYKLDFTKYIKIPKLRNNPVLSVKVSEDTLDEAKEKVAGIKDLVHVKYIIIPKIEENDEVITVKEDIIQIDHLQSLRDYILNNIGSNATIKEELNIITN